MRIDGPDEHRTSQKKVSPTRCATINRKTGEAVEATEINTTGSLAQGNGVRHSTCGSTMNHVVVSLRWAVLHCPRCGLRVEFPVGIKTFDELAAHFVNR